MSATQTILRRLLDRGHTQIDIAKLTGIPQPRLSRWAAGDTPAAADDALKLNTLLGELEGTPPAPLTQAGELSHVG